MSAKQFLALRVKPRFAAARPKPSRAARGISPRAASAMSSVCQRSSNCLSSRLCFRHSGATLPASARAAPAPREARGGAPAEGLSGRSRRSGGGAPAPRRWRGTCTAAHPRSAGLRRRAARAPGDGSQAREIATREREKRAADSGEPSSAEGTAGRMGRTNPSAMRLDP
jgi:hypothetical protein